jgi:hypothetical protein
MRPGMPVGFVLIFSVCHSVSLRSERIAPSRPQNHAIGGNLREIADESEIFGFKGTVGPQIPLGAQSLDLI